MPEVRTQSHAVAPPYPLLVAPIGSSMLDYIDNGTSAGDDKPPALRKICDVDPTGSLLAAVCAAPCEKDTTPPRVLLRGPRRSGRTSLVMEMAGAISSSSDPPCSGKCIGATARKPCQCIAVTMIVNANKTRNESFPLVCRRHVLTRKTDDLESKLDAIERQHHPLTWNTEALSRIQVHHLTSLRALAGYLLSVQARPIHEQPWGALIIDDIESFAQSDETMSTGQLMDVMKILAILVDTADFLERIHPSISVFATMESSSRLQPNNIDRLLTSWLPRTVSLVSSVASFGSTKEVGDIVESSWKAELVCTGMSSVPFPYNFVRKSDGSLQLLWTDQPV